MAKIVLASQSPRRRQLMEAAELDFEVVSSNADESVEETIPPGEVPLLLARRKALVVQSLRPDALIVAADTVVVLDGEILGKPDDAGDAVRILTTLSGRRHEVITGVCMLKGQQSSDFSVRTEVCFRPLSEEQILHYVNHYQPFDKAGAYAIQEWIGMIGIEQIFGDYYNVMGLPIGEVVKRLPAFQTI